MRHPEGMTHKNDFVLTHEGRGALTLRPISPFGRDNSDPLQDNDLPLWRNSVHDPERRPQVALKRPFITIWHVHPCVNKRDNPINQCLEGARFDQL